MKNGLTKGLITGMILGGSAATLFGVMNWQTEKKWNQKARQTGHWISRKADELTNRM